MLRTGLLVALLTCTTIAGCLDNDPATDPADTTPTSPIHLFDLVNATWPTGQGARDLIESYVMTHPFRLEGPATQSFMDTARDDLVTELESYGHHVERQAYSGGVNILAIQNGSVHPEQWVVLSAHYDTVGAGIGPTVYGAWDDGAGTGLLMELARALIDWDFPYTIVYAFFDGEEKGLVGSRNFVDTFGPEEQEEIDIVANLNMDPPGLNWPCGQMPLGHFPVKIIHEDGRVADGDHPRFTWLHGAVEYGLAEAGVPDNVRDYSPGIPIVTVAGEGVTGGSDHQSFGARGIANVFLGGTPTTYVGGSPDNNEGVAALTYPLHTPLDTLDAMEARCITGSLAGGLETIAQTMTNALIWMAQGTVPERGLVE